MAEFNVVFESENELNITFADEASMNVEFGEVTERAYDAYDGEIEFTPSEEEQIIHTQGTSVMTDLRINPIPSNYGLITWNGVTLTVS